MHTREINHIHFIGVGGIGMSALARLFLHEGKRVSGSDAAASENTKKLETEGVAVVYRQVAENITEDIDMVVYTEAMAQDHPELVAARACGIRTVNYFEALGVVANEYYVIAVSGTHGKTTTTAMLADIFEAAELDPSVVVGSLRSKTGSNYRAGKSKYFIVEACEYRRNFAHLDPDVLVILNLELDHVDYYQDLAAVQTAFREVVERVPEDGVIVTDVSNLNIAPILTDIPTQVIDYRQYVDPALSLKQPGIHNLMNAAAGAAVAIHEGADPQTVKTALEEFSGTWRRFEYKGVVNGAPVHDDYSHNPSKVAAAIATAREMYPNKQLRIIFQPHRYSRTKKLFDDFVQVLSAADHVTLAPIYAATTDDRADVSSEDLAAAIHTHGGHAVCIDTFNDIVADVQQSVSEKNVVIVVGAGDITKVATMLTTKQ